MSQQRGDRMFVALCLRLVVAITNYERRDNPWNDEKPFAILRWPERPSLEVEALVHMAPTLLGLPLVGASILFNLLAGVSLPLAAYLAINVVAYVVPSGTDTAPLKCVVRSLWHY